MIWGTVGGMPCRKKDYYKILGVSRNESTVGIRAAFRKLARSYHSDRAGLEATRIFQDITEAYSVLCDPDARKSYDQSLRTEAQIQRPHSAPKPWGAKTRTVSLQIRPNSIGRTTDCTKSQFEELFGDFFRRFSKARLAAEKRLEKAWGGSEGTTGSIGNTSFG